MSEIAGNDPTGKLSIIIETDALNAQNVLILADTADIQSTVNDIETVVETNQDFLDGTTPTPTAYRREIGVRQVKEFSITAAANAGLTTIATITDQPCLIKSIVLHSDGATTGDLTSAAIEGGAGSVIEFISALDAIQADFDAADKQIGWDGAVRLAATKEITIDLQGTGGTAVDFTVIIEYEATVDGGYLA